MLPDELTSTLDDNFYSFGGYQYLKEIKTDTELTELALFNGPTLIVTPFTDISEEDNTTQVPLPAVDLRALGYIPGTKLSLLDSKFKLISKEILIPTVIGSTPYYWWGVTLEQKALIANSKHGSRYFLQFQGRLELNLVQVLVSKEINPIEYEKLVEDWRRRLAGRTLDTNEALLTLEPDIGQVELYSKQGSRPSNYSKTIIRCESDTFVESSGGNSLYLNLQKDTWLLLREILSTEPSILNPINKTEETINQSLLDLGFEEIYASQNPNDYFSCWSKTNEESLQEVKVTFFAGTENWQVREYKEVTYKDLSIDTEGLNEPRLTGFQDYRYLFEISSAKSKFSQRISEGVVSYNLASNEPLHLNLKVVKPLESS